MQCVSTSSTRHNDDESTHTYTQQYYIIHTNFIIAKISAIIFSILATDYKQRFGSVVQLPAHRQSLNASGLVFLVCINGKEHLQHEQTTNYGKAKINDAPEQSQHTIGNGFAIVTIIDGQRGHQGARTGISADTGE